MQIFSIVLSVILALACLYVLMPRTKQQKTRRHLGRF